ncbi:DUF4214 domain-containing protein [Halomonas sp. Y3]|uniref:DUF4214 domain-containing protein n=1 Tax=Halomonas sp. Y3 TaxID=2956797 RepID=UPI00209FBA40|nr:DUF4214 domain-containing protein [Halomonas sp. Y3]
MATQESLNQAQLLYVAYYGRPADPQGQQYWAERIDAEGVGHILNAFGTSAEYENAFGNLSNAQLVNNLYNQLFGRDAEPAGLQFYVGLLSSGEKTLAEIAYEIAGGAQGDDAVALQNKLDVADAFTAGLDTTQEILAYEGNAAAASARDFLAGVDADTTVADVDVDGFINFLVTGDDGQPEPPAEGEEFRLTAEADVLTGTAGDDVFDASFTTIGGRDANTLGSGDRLDGGEGTDTLNAQLMTNATVTDTFLGTADATAISPRTENIEVVNIQVQSRLAQDVTVNGSNIDAQFMNGVQQWWSDNSRAYLQIEDIRSAPEETFFGMRDTDPNVSYAAFFNAREVALGQGRSDSFLTLTVRESGAPENELQNFTVNAVTIELDGSDYTLSNAAMAQANSFAEFKAALEAAIASEPALAGVTVSNNEDGTFVLVDEQGRDFAEGTVTTTQPGNFDIEGNQQVGDATLFDVLVETNVVLDGAGNGSQGGMLNIGAMSGQDGIGVFNTTVLNDSHLLAMSSVNLNAGNQPEGFLEIVNVVGDGDLTIGATRGDSTPVNELASTDGRAFGTDVDGNLVGLTDVRQVNADEFNGDLNVAINLTGDLGAKADSYFRDSGSSTNPDDDGSDFVGGTGASGEKYAPGFRYAGGNGDDIFTFDFDGEGGSGDNFFNALTGVELDTDVVIDIEGGAGNDRFNFNNSLIDRSVVSIDGGAGRDTVEVTTSSGTGTGAARWAAFDSIETLVIAGGDSNHAIITGNMSGLEDIVIATGDFQSGGFDNAVTQIEDGTDVTISGKNQTLSATNFNNDVNQTFGDIELVGLNVNTQHLNVTLDNTSRGAATSDTSELSVDSLRVDNVASTTVTSAGRREATNVVNTMSTSARTVDIDGTQDLDLHIDRMGQTQGGTTITGPRNIDATGLTGNLQTNGNLNQADLTLALSAQVVNGGGNGFGNGINPNANNYVGIKGTLNDNDTLQLYGALNTAAEISEFETIQFGAPFAATGAGAQGYFSASNTTGVEVFDVALLAGDLTLDSLRDESYVEVSGNIGSGITLELIGETGVNELDVALSGGIHEGTLDIQSATNVEISSLVAAGSTLENLTLDATVEDLTLINVALDNVAVFDSISKIDLSDSAGSTLTLQDAGAAATETTIVIGAGDVDITSNSNEAVNFEFVAASQNSGAPSEWVISGFDLSQDVLDFSEFGIYGSLGDIDIDYVFTGPFFTGTWSAVITSDVGQNDPNYWELTIEDGLGTGFLGLNELDASNFAFA